MLLFNYISYTTQVRRLISECGADMGDEDLKTGFRGKRHSSDRGMDRSRPTGMKTEEEYSSFIYSGSGSGSGDENDETSRGRSKTKTGTKTRTTMTKSTTTGTSKDTTGNTDSSSRNKTKPMGPDVEVEVGPEFIPFEVVDDILMLSSAFQYGKLECNSCICIVVDVTLWASIACHVQ